MSRVVKLKHVKREIDADDLSLPTEKEIIVRVVSSKGNNLHEVEDADSSDNFLVSMPNKFRKNVWIKRGSFVLIEAISEGDRVKGEIIRILTPEHQKEFIKHGVWPKKFSNKRSSDEIESDDDGSEPELLQNQNRRIEHNKHETSSSESE